jgi:nicotinamidase/pyrazinamidase
MKNIHLVLVDYQISFCDPKRGELYVPHAEIDCQNVANLIDRVGSKLTDITVTLDSHYPIHIAHGCWWKGRDGKNPPPFTMITVEDIENGTWS